jgi:hypothetical protein
MCLYELFCIINTIKINDVNELYATCMNNYIHVYSLSIRIIIDRI